MIVYDDYLPDFPRTRHLPWQPNASRDDLVASEADCTVVFTANVQVTEKVDGANVGLALVDGEPLIRNRNHILNKSHAARTAAKAQFNPLWNWFYENREAFERLGSSFSVYGEWLMAVHSVHYTRLPSHFLAFDVFDQETKRFVDPHKARRQLTEAGFPCVPVLHSGPVANVKQLTDMIACKSLFSDEIREGVYLKIGDGTNMTHRFKMVRTGFIAGEHWSQKKITKNVVVRGQP